MGKFEYPPSPLSSSASGFFQSELPQKLPDSSSSHGVAIVGMSCRTAGGNTNPEQLWQFILEKKHGSGEVPMKRWQPWLRRDPRNARIIETMNHKGYFINNLENFDAAFFGISPKEAELMDPHQRLALELSWEALEHAGIDPAALSGSDTAVYMGVDSDDYSRLIMEDLPNVEAWSGIGTAYHGIPNRISYHLDLRGPSTAVDAACASSLVAIHLAHQAIVSGESTVALCGGVNVLCAPGLTYMLEKAGALSPDGVCLSFDDNACGYARGEGGAIIVLKRLVSAIADNDNILAVLKGTASAQDGKTNGIMAPNAKAQELVARQALRRAGDMDPLTIGYIEAHATATSLGDPTEISAIANVYGAQRPKDAPCAMGSIKPNVGHLEAAAGAIGLVKAVLAISKGELAPQALLKKLNTRIDWANSGLRVVREHSKWPESGGLRRAAVCSYGYGGSVSHAILEQAPLEYVDAQSFPKNITHAEREVAVSLILSSFQEKRLVGHASALADWLADEGRQVDLRAIANTLAQRRAAQDYRVAFTVTSHNDAIEVLGNYINGSMSVWTVSNRVLSSTTRRDVVYVYSGHGAHWPDMGKQLLTNPVFFEAVGNLNSIIEEEAGFSPISALRCGDLGDSDRIQVLTYVVQIGLTAVLESNGTKPQAIIGHSVGEIAASVAAGCLTSKEGAILVSRRAKLYAHVKGQGGMFLVHLPFETVVAELGPRRDIVAAICSSPSSCVISGETTALENYVASLCNRGVRNFRVKTDIAFHSPTLEKLVEPFISLLSGMLDPRPANFPIYSTSSLDPRSYELRTAEYWARNMIGPVWLTDAVEAALTDGYHIFLEVSTHPIVAHSVSETFAAQGFEESASFGVMSRNAPAELSIKHAVAHLYTLGATVDFKTHFGKSDWAKTVPGTPWVHKPYWKNVETGYLRYAHQHDINKHTLIGQCVDVAGCDTRVYSTILDENRKPYPLNHPLDGTEIIPAAVYCNTFYFATGATLLNGLQLRVPTTMTAEQREVQVVVSDRKALLCSRLKSSADMSQGTQHMWIENSSCQWSIEEMTTFHRTIDIASMKQCIGKALHNGFAWEFLQKIGVSGIAFPWAVLEHYGNAKEMIVKMDMDPNAATLGWDIHSWAPFLDAATSVGSSIFFEDAKMRIVSGIDQVQFISKKVPPRIGYLYIQKSNDDKSLAANISVLDEGGQLLVKLQKMRFSDVETDAERTTGVDALVHRLSWIAPSLAESPMPLNNVLLLTDDNELARCYLDELRPLSETLKYITTAKLIEESDSTDVLENQPLVVIHLPARVQSLEAIAERAHAFTWEAASILNILVERDVTGRLFIITDQVHKSESPTALAQAPLQGFARIAAQEHPELWGALIDNETESFPGIAIKYVQGEDLIRMQDGVPRVARLRPFTDNHRRKADSLKTLLPKPHGTYVVTGGFGDIGLEILDFLVSRGAFRIVVISRRNLPARSTWTGITGQMKVVVDKVRALEDRGATVYSIALDIGAANADVKLRTALDGLSLPPVLGVVHAAGIKEDVLIKDTTSSSFGRVFGPKISGTLSLHKVFPPKTLDFFVLFSSIGQLVGTSGQATYGASNAFLDTLATHRRNQGDNAVAFQWTAWRGMGMVAGDNEFLDIELSSKGITDITCEEGFQAWEHTSNFDTDHAVVTRVRILDANEPVPYPLVAEIATRRRQTHLASASSNPSDVPAAKPASGPQLKSCLTAQVKQCLSTVLHLDVEDIDIRAVVADLGLDSVMVGALRWEMQKIMGLKVPPTLIWKVGTVAGLVHWAMEKARESE